MINNAEEFVLSLLQKYSLRNANNKLSIEIFRYKTMRRMFYFQWKGGREQYFKIEIVELF